jgi:ABC-2 type transport system permease protein
MVNSFRFGILGVSDVDIRLSLTIMTLATIGLYIYALRLLKSGKGMKE